MSKVVSAGQFELSLGPGSVGIVSWKHGLSGVGRVVPAGQGGLRKCGLGMAVGAGAACCVRNVMGDEVSLRQCTPAAIHLICDPT